MGFPEKSQGPINVIFPRGEHSFLGFHTFNVIGSGILANRTTPPTGQPTGVGSGGVPEVSATYSATGIYRIRFPVAKGGTISASVTSSSGYQFDPYLVDVSYPSGSAELHIKRNGGTGVITPQASGSLGFMPTGTRVDLQFFVAPASDGITAF